jgi:hypothetical protein
MDRWYGRPIGVSTLEPWHDFFAGIHGNLLYPLAILGITDGGQMIAQFAASVLESYESLQSYAPLVETSPLRADFIVSWVLAEASELIRILTTCALVLLKGILSHSIRQSLILARIRFWKIY